MQTDGTYLPNIVDFGQFLITHARWDRALRLHQNLLIQSRKLASDDVRDQVLYNLALSSHELGLKDKATQYLERLLAKRPDHHAGLELKRRVLA